MSYPRTPTTTTSAATTTPNATPNEPYDASPATPTVSATPSVSTPSKPHSSPTAASVTAIFDAASSPLHRLADSPCAVDMNRLADSLQMARSDQIVANGVRTLVRAVTVNVCPWWACRLGLRLG